MIVETTLAVVVIGAMISAKRLSSLKKSREQLALKTRQEEELKRSLYGLRGGVWIREPNGSQHMIQNLVEQALSRRSMALFDLRNDHVRTLLKSGKWNPEIANGFLDVAIIGRMVTQEREVDEYVYISVQHVDTATGRRFDQLDFTHPNRRKPNSGSKSYLLESNGYSRDYYFEPREEFTRRREMEKTLAQGVARISYTLDVRFYGPEGQIRGGCVATTNSTTDSPMQQLAELLVNAIAQAVRPSVDAHDRNKAFTELDFPSLPSG